MNKLLLKNKHIPKLCRVASGEWETWLPIESIAGDVHFEKITDNNDPSIERMNLEYKSLVIPPKNIGFPQIESLFTFEDGRISETVPSPTKKLILGIRACDLSGMLFVIEKLLKTGFIESDIYVTLERHMKCGIGKCGHCAMGTKFVCVDGPVFSMSQMNTLPEKERDL